MAQRDGFQCISDVFMAPVFWMSFCVCCVPHASKYVKDEVWWIESCVCSTTAKERFVNVVT